MTSWLTTLQANEILKEELSKRHATPEFDALRKELGAAQALAATRHAEANAWETRYEELKPQLTAAAARETEE